MTAPFRPPLVETMPDAPPAPSRSDRAFNRLAAIVILYFAAQMVRGLWHWLG